MNTENTENSSVDKVVQAMTALGFHGYYTGGGCDCYRMSEDSEQGINAGWVNRMLDHYGLEPVNPLDMVEVIVTSVENGAQMPVQDGEPVMVGIYDADQEMVREFHSTVAEMRLITKGWG
jgi:hypothetical protein